ncbi:MAG TPA: hypothetical protein DDZ51_11650 [Planctomycetaceae bacterium]|nr:hypothetical protein [Planctomycetaceae bacterium]
MQFQLTDRIQTNVPAGRLLDSLENQFRGKSKSLNRIGDSLSVHGIEASFGSINRTDRTDVTVRPANGGYVLVADVKYSPSVFFWIILIVTIFTYVFWLIPIAFYLLQKKTVKEGIQDCFRNVINELGGVNVDAPQSLQTSIADLERLGGLLQQGLITQAEFDGQKAKIFGATPVQLPLPIPKVDANSHPHVPDCEIPLADPTLQTDRDAQALFDEAKMHIGKGDKELAIGTLRMLIEKFPNTSAAARARRSIAPKPRP